MLIWREISQNASANETIIVSASINNSKEVTYSSILAGMELETVEWLHAHGPSWREHFLKRHRFSNSVHYFLPWSNFVYFPLRVCVCVFHSSLFTVVITVCICNMCEHSICLLPSFCAHYSMEQWSTGNARTFLKMVLLVSNSSCSKCCISCALSLLILKIIQGTWFSLHTFKNTREKWHEGRREFSQRFLDGIFQANIFMSISYLSRNKLYYWNNISLTGFKI